MSERDIVALVIVAAHIGGQRKVQGETPELVCGQAFVWADAFLRAKSASGNDPTTDPNPESTESPT